ncbi:MAG: ABC transporter permease [Candidatus Sericytochromatia bacterium]|nr:ABC transporter permease [Candidatus Sericytochromatia bacterium]
MTVPTTLAAPPPLSRTALWWSRARRNRSFVIGAVIIALFLLVSAVPGLFAPADPLVGDLSGSRLLPPSTAHWFGTDDLGRDILSRILYGARISLAVSVLSLGVSLLLGPVIGLCAGYFGRRVDDVLMRAMDILQAFPSILLAILIVAILGPGLVNAMIAIGIVNMPLYARLVRAAVVQLRNQEFVEASRAMGAGHSRVLFMHLLPNCLSPILVQATLGIASAILETAGLSFLGLGAQPPMPEWGAMLANAKDFIRSAPWTIAFPGLAIIAVVLGFNLLGDGLRDLLDPRTAKLR